MSSSQAESDHTLDLHGQTWHEALPDFIAFYNQALARAGGFAPETLDIIHGYGSTGNGGVLRTRLRHFLAEHAAQGRLDFTPGENIGANPGHTLVTPIQPLPAAHEMLAEEVLAYCARPRTLSKISGKFRRHGEPAVKTAVDTLVRQRRLRPVARGTRKAYAAIQDSSTVEEGAGNSPRTSG